VSGAAADRPPVALLVVCTGNICRSPAAELLLHRGLGNGAGIVVASAGLAARAAEPVAAPMARLLAARGVDPRGFVARQLHPPLLRTSGLVLTMTAAQRSAVVSRVPAAVRRTFTLREFADLARLAGDPPEARQPADRLTALVTAAPRLRALRTGTADDDIEDPYGRPADVFASVLDRIEAAVGAMLGALMPTFRSPTVSGARTYARSGALSGE
jgi:low molecular weight protein-tyrosine phosphatase